MLVYSWYGFVVVLVQQRCRQLLAIVGEINYKDHWNEWLRQRVRKSSEKLSRDPIESKWIAKKNRRPTNVENRNVVNHTEIKSKGRTLKIPKLVETRFCNMLLQPYSSIYDL